MLPPLTESSDLPVGIHAAGWDEIERRFGEGSLLRKRACAKLRHLYELAERAGGLRRFLVFGSFLSVTAEPHDVDVALVMAADFRLEDAPRESKTLFSHADAEARFGASVFWVREGMFPEDLMESFLETWQRKRDGTKRGILEIKP
ncbi:MAG: hypothetical protein HY017_23270 [Betaproteobacteria bacterium]|nr:hypothetical protein [Betaproteobacteria bacterium]